MDDVGEILRAARALGASEAEVYLKTARGRRVVLEPRLAGGRARISVSTFSEEGVALRVRDRHGRPGFAWGSPACSGGTTDLADLAMAAAGRSSAGAGAGPAGDVPCAPPLAGPPPDLEIDDPEIADAPEDRLIGRLEEAADAASAAGASADVDRAVLSAASTTIGLANSLGFAGAYSKTIAHLSVSMAPVSPGARAVLEERAACRLRDLAPRECGFEAARRALPPRPLVPPPAADLPLILPPRAAASLLRALLPFILEGAAAGEVGARRPSRGGLTVIDDARLPGRLGSAPFDGAGRPTGRTLLLACGRIVESLSAEGGSAVRTSFREPPVIGPSNVYVPPSGRLDPADGRVDDRRGDDLDPGSPSGPCLRITAAAFVPGPVFRIRILRGDWHDGAGAAGPADGLCWEGPRQAILEGVTAAGSDLRFFHPDRPVGAPSLRIEGLGPWMVEGAAARPSAGRVAARPPGRPAGPGDQAASG